MKVLSLFSGIGAFEKALDRLEVNYELVNYCEIDKYASKAYAMLHDCDESFNLGDITKIDTSVLPNDIDLITYGFPCQDISSEGKQKGFETDGERTRSGLFYEALRVIEDTKPKIAIAENVKNLVSKKFSKEFDIVLSSLEEVGYNNYYKVLNAKDYIPQNRERVFIVSIRKDVDTGSFVFPAPIATKRTLKDILDNNVKFEKYKVPESILEKIVISTDPLKIKNATKQGYIECNLYDSITTSFPNSQAKRGRVGKQCSQTLTTSKIMAVNTPEGIRYLTEKECFRLMGFDDIDFEKIKDTKSTYLYKQAGNSIVVDVLVHLFKSLFKALELNKHAEIIKQPTLFDLDKEEI
jgi:DNA (cytosine-5-)-methyltransferase